MSIKPKKNNDETALWTWLATGQRKTAAAFPQLPSLCWCRAIFPGRRQPSIVATDELNFRVRNGNGWTLIVIGTNFVEIDLTGFVSVVSVRAAKTRWRSVVSPLSIEASASIEFTRGMRCVSHCTLKTEQRGGQGRPEPAVLANL